MTVGGESKTQRQDKVRGKTMTAERAKQSEMQSRMKDNDC